MSVGVDDGGDVGVGVFVGVDGSVGVVVADGFVDVDVGDNVVGGTVDTVTPVPTGVEDEKDGAAVAALVGNRTSARLVPGGRSLL